MFWRANLSSEKSYLIKVQKNLLFLNFRWPLEKKCVKPLEHRLRKNLSVRLCLLSLLGYVFDIQENASIKHFSFSSLSFLLIFPKFSLSCSHSKGILKPKSAFRAFFFPFSMSQHLKAGQLLCSWLYLCKSWSFYSLSLGISLGRHREWDCSRWQNRHKQKQRG